MEHIKLGPNEEKPTGEATVTPTGMRRDRDSIDDFEHVDRETSPVDKASKVVSEFEFDKSNDFGAQYLPKHGIESGLGGLPKPSITLGDERPLDQHTKGSIDSSGLENFLRNEKGFMSSELDEGTGQGMLDEFKRDIMETASSILAESDAFPEPLLAGQDKASNAHFISTEATEISEKEKYIPGHADGDSSKKTESGLGFPGIGENVVEGFKTPMFSDDFLHDTLPPAKLTDSEKMHFEDMGPTSFVTDTKSRPMFEQESTDLPSKQHEPTDLPPTKQEPKAVPLKKEPAGPPAKKEPKDLHFIQEPIGLPVGQPSKQQLEGELFAPGMKQEPVERTEVTTKPVKEVAVDEITEPMELFCKMGLDAWFKPERLHPTVVELVYWRDPKKSGVVFGTILGVLLSLSYFSLISVIAYLSLAVLTITIAYRIYKNIVQAVQKTSDGHPFKEILDLDLTLPQDKVRELTDMTVNHLNAAAIELRRLFLVEDLVDSIKFGVLLWCMTYLGSWFNGMTIIIIMFVAMFTLPKVYENNKTQIDQNLEIARAKLADISAKVKAAVPIGKKPVVEEKKEQ